MSGESSSFAPTGRSVDAGRSIEWLRQGWTLFTKNPGMWIAIVIIFTVISIVLVFVPILGGLISNLLMPVFIGGLMLGCRSLEEDGEFGIDALFAGFKQNTGNLVMVGVLYLVGIIVVGMILLAILLAIGGSALIKAGLFSGQITEGSMATLAGGALIAILVALALMVPLAMAVWFAPQLVIFRDIAPFEAMKASFFACLKNILPFLVYGLILLVLSFIASIPFGLGMLVLGPVLIGTHYASYMDLFE